VKTRERSAAGGGGGRQSVPGPLGGQVGGDRLPMAPRERKPALAALAVLLILLGALGATVMVLRAGDKISVVEITQNVAAGRPIPQSAIRSVDVSDVSGVTFIRWNQRGNLQSSFVAATNLTPDSVLVRSMITEKGDALAAGKTLVGLSLKEGQYPDGLKAGDTVAAYLVGNDAKTSTSAGSSSTSGSSDSGSSGADSGSGGASTRISAHLVIESMGGSGSSLGGTDNTSVTVLADDADTGPLTIAASANEVALVLVPNKS
jgi:hypothetical protein